MIPAHQTPQCTPIGRDDDHEQCPVDFRKRDDALTAATAGSTLGLLIRVAGGYDPKKNTWSRSRCSFQWNRHMELGWAHVSMSNSWELLGKIATELPEVAYFAFGDLSRAMPDKAWQERMYEEVRGRTEHAAKYDQYIAGWAQICGRADVQDIYTREWFKEYVAPVVKVMQANNARSCRMLALGARMLGSAPANLSVIRTALERHGDSEKAFDYAAGKYGKSSRVERIKSLIPASCVIQTWPNPSDIRWPSTAPGLASDIRFNRPGDTSGSNQWAVPIIILALGVGGYVLWRRFKG